MSDASGNVLFSNSEYRARFAQNGTTPDELETAGLDADELTRLDVTIQKEKYVCLMQPLSVYGWRMIFLSPVESLYQAPNRGFQIMLLVLAVTMLFGVWFAYQLARQNGRDINNVIRSIQRAKQGKTVEKSKGEPGRVQRDAPECRGYVSGKGIPGPFSWPKDGTTPNAAGIAGAAKQ